MNNLQVQFRSLQKAYHYTTFQTAIKILESKSLRFGKLNNMNDFHENDKLCFVDSNKNPIGFDSFDVLEALQDEIYKYRQISFSVDSDNRKGFDLHQMWGLYADKGQGVCLVFDKDMLCKQIDDAVLHKIVSYDTSVESFYIANSNDSQSIQRNIQKQAEKLFFHKRKEWEHEQEYRFIKRCTNLNKEEYLYYGKALKYIILNSAIEDADVNIFKKMVMDLKTHSKDVPQLLYGNALLDYSLIDINHTEIIWNSSHGYDILIPGVNCEIDV